MSGPVVRSGPPRQEGLGLVEIMVGLAISAILVAGILQIFLGSRHSYRVAEAGARMQESGRYAVQMLSDDLRMAGYTGCIGPDSLDSRLTPPDDYRWHVAAPLVGHAAAGSSWIPALPSLIAADALPGSDVVVVRGMARDALPANRSGKSADLTVESDTPVEIQAGDVLVASDCERGAVFLAEGTTDSGGRRRILHAGLNGHSYDGSTEVGRLQTTVYYVAANETGDPALFRRTLINDSGNPRMSDPQELVDNAERLEILYGVDTDSDGVANRYVTAQHVADMGNVVSIRFSLVLRSEDHLLGEPQTYHYHGQTHTADDRRLRRVFGSTIKLRNRGLL